MFSVSLFKPTPHSIKTPNSFGAIAEESYNGVVELYHKAVETMDNLKILRLRRLKHEALSVNWRRLNSIRNYMHMKLQSTHHNEPIAHPHQQNTYKNITMSSGSKCTHFLSSTRITVLGSRYDIESKFAYPSPAHITFAKLTGLNVYITTDGIYSTMPITKLERDKLSISDYFLTMPCAICNTNDMNDCKKYMCVLSGVKMLCASCLKSVESCPFCVFGTQECSVSNESIDPAKSKKKVINVIGASDKYTLFDFDTNIETNIEFEWAIESNTCALFTIKLDLAASDEDVQWLCGIIKTIYSGSYHESNTFLFYFDSFAAINKDVINTITFNSSVFSYVALPTLNTPTLDYFEKIKPVDFISGSKNKATHVFFNQNQSLALMASATAPLKLETFTQLSDLTYTDDIFNDGRMFKYIVVQSEAEAEKAAILSDKSRWDYTPYIEQPKNVSLFFMLLTLFNIYDNATYLDIYDEYIPYSSNPTTTRFFTVRLFKNGRMVTIVVSTDPFIEFNNQSNNHNLVQLLIYKAYCKLFFGKYNDLSSHSLSMMMYTLTGILVEQRATQPIVMNNNNSVFFEQDSSWYYAVTINEEIMWYRTTDRMLVSSIDSSANNAGIAPIFYHIPTPLYSKNYTILPGNRTRVVNIEKNISLGDTCWHFKFPNNIGEEENLCIEANFFLIPTENNTSTFKYSIEDGESGTQVYCCDSVSPYTQHVRILKKHDIASSISIKITWVPRSSIDTVPFMDKFFNNANITIHSCVMPLN